MAVLLIVDDEPNVRYSLEKGLAEPGREIISVGTAAEGIALAAQRTPDAVILDVRLPDLSGLKAHERIRQLDPRLPVIMITAHTTTETAIEAMKMGAFEYLLKPLDLHQVREVVDRALEVSRLSRTPAVYDDAAPQDADADRIVGQSPGMQEAYKAIGRVAALEVPVLILGESGTGKELVARAIYQHGRRAAAPFLAINCAAIPEPLLESELFGHERGAFTGADQRRIGKFEQAHGGTILMDEIGDMGLGLQAKLLRLLQERQFQRVGGNDTIVSDVRVIAATNRDLEGLVAAGRFRQDLYYRLNVFTIHLPPLRERTGDLPLLIEHFLKTTNRELGRQVQAVVPDAMRLLERHSWPGNVRELASAIKFALVHATGHVVTVECLPEAVRLGPAAPAASGAFADVAARVRGLLAAGEPDVYHAIHALIDRVILDEALRHTKGNQLQAAELLGMSRTTLRARLRSLGLSIEKQLGSDEPAGS